MAFRETRRFIAGAVCPRCAAQDRIVTYHNDGVDFRECIDCGFADEMRIKPPARQLETRVNTPAEERAAQEQVVRILPPKK